MLSVSCKQVACALLFVTPSTRGDLGGGAGDLYRFSPDRIFLVGSTYYF